MSVCDDCTVGKQGVFSPCYCPVKGQEIREVNGVAPLSVVMNEEFVGPESCPLPPILKILAEAVEIDDVEISELGARLRHWNGQDHRGWQKVEFWMRR